VLDDLDPSDWDVAIERQLAAMPGWTGFIKYRAEEDSSWQSEAPITLIDYLAVRLQFARHFDAPLVQDDDASQQTAYSPFQHQNTPETPLHAVWLNALEETYRTRLLDGLREAAGDADTSEQDRPTAQLVFCIDTRSEIIRRHVEAQGDYHTHGYAGFFGIPMSYTDYTSNTDIDACPPIVDPEHRIEDHPDPTSDSDRQAFEASRAHQQAGGDLLDSLQSNPATAFSFVESAGFGYGAALAARTLIPGKVRDWLTGLDEWAPSLAEICSPTIDPEDARASDADTGLTLEQQVEYAANAFELMGWQHFGRLVVFVGHAAETTNNPFDSSLDCGACAANPGGPSARTLAAICRSPEVQKKLVERGIEIPEDAVFLAGEHNTTTDEITLFDDHVPTSHQPDLQALKADLRDARIGATTERTRALDADASDPPRETERRSADWAQTRPEWGLAGNASFVIGPRTWTGELNLAGRAFLHSYDWTTDPEGDALEAIMTGPMVVTQWINNQYYFATVDNAVYGSGSKITHNPTGNIGVFQGNGGDLMCGLPLQSVKSDDDTAFHQPLRLSTVIEAPVERVQSILSRHDQLVTLLDHEWLSLTVVDPTQERQRFEYDGELTWSPVRTQPARLQPATTRS
jgi:uncharacterized protein YbcC (UPF0753/DUF2309 family)